MTLSFRLQRARWLLLLMVVLPVTMALTWYRAQASTVEHVMKFGGLDRVYRLHVPPNHQANRPSPLVVVLHGGGGTARQMENYTRFSRLADREDFLVVYPQAVEKNWNDGRRGVDSRAAREGIDDDGFICAVIDEVARSQAVDRRRVHVTGISNGAFMSSRLGAAHADRFASLAPVVGGIAVDWIDTLHPSRPLSVLVIQGTADPLVPYHGGVVGFPRKPRGRMVSTDRALEYWREADGIRGKGHEALLPDVNVHDGCRVRTTTWTGGRAGTEVILYKIEGGGHGWPGGIQYLPRAVIGTACQDFDATATIWSFFKDHPRN